MDDRNDCDTRALQSDRMLPGWTVAAVTGTATVLVNGTPIGRTPEALRAAVGAAG